MEGMGRIEGSKRTWQSTLEHGKHLLFLMQKGKEGKTMLWAPSKSRSYGQRTSYNCTGRPTTPTSVSSNLLWWLPLAKSKQNPKVKGKGVWYTEQGPRWNKIKVRRELRQDINMSQNVKERKQCHVPNFDLRIKWNNECMICIKVLSQKGSINDS